PYQGLIVAEPLAAPFERPGSGQWIGITSNTVLSGAPQLSLRFTPNDRAYPPPPIQQVDLFVDGKYLRTLTNLAPAAGNVLTVALNGYPVSYAVPSNSSLTTIATGLASAINGQEITNITKVIAFVYGDRVELHSTSTNQGPDPVFFAD